MSAPWPVTHIWSASPFQCVQKSVKESLDDIVNMFMQLLPVTGDHKMISVEHLADLTKSKLELYKEQAEERFEVLSALIKETTIQIGQWDVDTEANIRIIHRTRDEQVQ